MIGPGRRPSSTSPLSLLLLLSSCLAARRPVSTEASSHASRTMHFCSQTRGITTRNDHLSRPQVPRDPRYLPSGRDAYQVGAVRDTPHTQPSRYCGIFSWCNLLPQSGVLVPNGKIEAGKIEAD
ncbi:hypothetical protein B0T22DRAFT_455728 [Podospora appendiculata]|uniref:Uncharacterized protein n=1 Tax=Podospora appendiculata TaxID=314037 RepID=A0AAE0XLS5_9PEZI|nr:hypothetical protein B0T22DRAFT_455728 [Podospora appendiculata]